MTDLLARIDAAIDGLCPCGAAPRPGSPYCSADCEPTHRAADTGYSAMRWRPELVTATDDSDLMPIGNAIRAADTVAIRDGRHNATMYQRATNPTVWHLRLDDGHRYVGCDLPDMGILNEIISVEQIARIHDAWQRLERELTDLRRTEPAIGGRVDVGVRIDPEYLARVITAARAAVVTVAEAMNSAMRGLSAAATQLKAAGALPETPPTDPMARALWLRQHRNTGPAAYRLDGRRRRQ